MFCKGASSSSSLELRLPSKLARNQTCRTTFRRQHRPSQVSLISCRSSNEMYWAVHGVVEPIREVIESGNGPSESATESAARVRGVRFTCRPFRPCQVGKIYNSQQVTSPVSVGCVWCGATVFSVSPCSWSSCLRFRHLSRRVTPSARQMQVGSSDAWHQGRTVCGRRALHSRRKPLVIMNLVGSTLWQHPHIVASVHLSNDALLF